MDNLGSSTFGAFLTSTTAKTPPTQKKRPGIDACAARLSDTASRTSWGGASSTRKLKATGSSRITDSPEKPGICMECGEPSDWGEPCESCAQSSSSTRPSTSCVVCNEHVNPSQGRTCATCRKWVHKHCDATEVGLLEDFVCCACRQSPLVGDAMLSGSTSLLGGSPDPPSANLNLSGSASPLHPEPQPFDDLYFPPNAEPTEETEMSVPSTPSEDESGERDSPGFFPENTPSSDNDDFKPRKSTSSSRGGKAGKKKPGRGGSVAASQMKTRSGGERYSEIKIQSVGQPPSGIFSAVGKAEGGGGGGGGRGKRAGSQPRSASNKANGKGGANGGGAAGGAGNLRGRRSSARGSSSHMIVSGREMDEDTLGSVRDYASASGAMGGSESSRGSRADNGGQYVRTPVVADANDAFLDAAPLCLVCGAVGKGEEGSQVTCASCAHTYHTYCVNLHDKLNSTLVQRGWRCLDCTVCEGCGEGGDESKLLLCEECDVAYHIYCLSPPLDRIPSGAWRCQYCAKCRRCSIRTTDLTREGLCHPCYSLRKCPKCAKLYQIGDAIIRCSTCQRWFHGRCEDLNTEEQLEDACQNRMRCSQCRPHLGAFHIPGDNSTQIICDNVALTKSANELLQSKMMPQLFRNNSFMDTILDDDSMQDELDFITAGRGRMRGGPGRRVPKLGVGGFYVKIPRHRLATADEETATPTPGEEEKPRMKRPRKPRRSQLEDAYPAAIQEGFFGIKAVDGKTMLETVIEEPHIRCEYTKPPNIDRPTDGSEMAHNEAGLQTMDMHLNDQELNMLTGDMDFDPDAFNFDLLADDDDEDTLDDSLNDAYELAANDGFSLSRSNSGMAAPAQNPTQDPLARIGLPPQAQLVQPPQHFGSPGFPMAPGVVPAAPPTLSRSSSQMEGGQERVRGAKEIATERWEEDEPLGHRATKAAVLYANVNYPTLKETHPQWSERVKQIQRIWRGLDTESRSEYVNRARENRASRAKTKKPPATPTQPNAPPQPDPSVPPHLAMAVPQQQQPQPQFIQQTPAHPQLHHPVLPVQQPGPSGMGQPPQFGPPGMRPEFKVPTMPSMIGGPGSLPPPGYFDGIEDNKAALHQQLMQQAQQMPPQQQPPGMPPQGMPPGLQMPPQGINSAAAVANNQQRALEQLTPQQSEQYSLLRKRTGDLTKQQEMLETDLGRMRKQKKNIAAKRRQLQKTAAAEATATVDPQAATPGAQDLPDTDMQTLNELNTQIPIRQKELEACKRESKSHQTAMLEFETKHGLNVPPPSPVGQPPGTPGGQPRPSGAAPPPQLMMRPQYMPPGYPQQPMPGMVGPMGQPGMPLQGHPGTPGTPQMRMQMAYPPPGLIDPPGVHTPTTPRPGSAASDGTKKGRKRKGADDTPTPGPMHPQGMPMMPMSMPPPMWLRSETLGGRRFDQLQTEFERGAYEVLDDIIHRLTRHFEPPPPMPADTALKRILGGGCTTPLEGGRQQTMGGAPGSSAIPMLGPGPLAEPPKAKKKRTQQKKTGGVQASEYELMVERVITQLRLCPGLPRKQLEPPAKNDRQAFGAILTELPERADKETILGDFGNLRLAFMNDYYSAWERLKEPLRLPSLPSMSHLAPGASLQALNLPERTEGDNSETFKDSEDEKEPSCSGAPEAAALVGITYSRLFVRPPPQPTVKQEEGEEIREPLKETRAASPPVRLLGRVADPPLRPPSEPPRARFEALRDVEREPSVEVEIPVCAVVKTEEGGIVNLFEQLKEILGSNGKYELVNFELVTPPQSPEHELTREIKREPGVVSPPPAPPPIRCRACEQMMREALVQQTMSQLGLTPSDDGKDDKVSFCSLKCYYDFAAASKVALSPDQLQAAEAHVDEATLAKLRQISAESFAKCIQEGVTRPPPVLPDSFLTSPRDTRYVMDEGRGRENLKCIRVADFPPFGEGRGSAEKQAEKPDGRRSEGWMVYDQNTLDSFIRVKVLKQELAVSEKLGVSPAPHDLDKRRCAFCSQVGDGEAGVCGRLLNLDADQWVHVNCALWSSEVYETTSGGLVRVEDAIRRAKTTRCNVCGGFGASIQCYKVDCPMNFHLPCAKRAEGSKFIRDKTFHCSRHTDTSSDVLVHSLHALRRIYIDRDAENDVLAKVFEVAGEGSARLALRLGSITLHAIGQLLPEQLKAFHNSNYIFPIGYSITRLYWSPSEPRMRVPFECRIGERSRLPEFTVTVHGKTSAERTATGAWRPFLEQVAALRVQSGDVLRLWPSTIVGETLFGLSEPSVSKVTESLPGVDSLLTYQFRHGGAPLMDLPLAVNPSGCARCEPRFRTLIKHQQRPLTTGGSTSRTTTSTAEGRTRGSATSTSTSSQAELRAILTASGIDPALAQFAGGLSLSSLTGGRPQIYSEYQKMRKEWRQYVYLARSKIQGLGLYAKRDLDMGSFIIEYKGEVIRSEVCEVREKKYFAQNRGTYMFRIDEDWVVDATMAGGPARYINHSCDPNCSARILEIGQGEKKIIITANRPIKAGEELAYDYQFDLEDDTSKVPCLCGAPNCVKWMN